MNSSNDEKFDQLRRLAEELLKKNSSRSVSGEDEIPRLLHELRVHQMELEIQNEELRRSQDALDESRNEYVDLFDYAPVSYFIMDDRGVIINANLTAVAKFGTTRDMLKGKPLALLIEFSERDLYYQYHRSLVGDSEPGAIEVWFNAEDGSQFFGRIETQIYDDERGLFRVAISDITERKITESQLQTVLQLAKTTLEGNPIELIVHNTISSIEQFMDVGLLQVIVFKPDESEAVVFSKDNEIDKSLIRSQRQPIELYSSVVTTELQSPRTMTNPSYLSEETQERYPAHYIFPLYYNDEALGILDIGADSMSRLQALSVAYVAQITFQLSMAIQQANLTSKVQQYTQNLEELVDQRTKALEISRAKEHSQRRFTEKMLSVAKHINQSLDLSSVFELILNSLQDIIKYDGAQLIVINSDSNASDHLVQTSGDLQIRDIKSTAPLIDSNPLLLKLSRGLNPIIINRDAFKKLNCDDNQYNVAIQSYLGVPIKSGKSLLGFISLFGTTPEMFATEDVEHLNAFAEHSAIAIKNAWAYQQGQALAAIEERQRLARDLHDSVSQLVFTLSIMAEALSKSVKKGEADKVSKLADDVQHIASSVYAEMRLLLLELRPRSFSQTSLAELINQLTTAFVGRHADTHFEVNVDADISLPVELKTVFYRIVQEALNNIGKHARASDVKITMVENNGILFLTIQDNGLGFDTSASTPNHGLQIMQERATSIGAELNVESAKKKGTTVSVSYPLSTS